MSTLLGRMRAIMDEAEIKPSRLTAELGISASSFTDWGKGKGSPSVSILAKFAEYFNVSLDYLVFGKEPGCVIMENSNSKKTEHCNDSDKELLEKYHALPTEYQIKLLGYIDGMSAVVSDQSLKDKTVDSEAV